MFPSFLVKLSAPTGKQKSLWFIILTGGTDGDDCIDLDLDDPNSPVQRRQYKSFQPNVKLQPTDVIFKEENSRAAPRKGVEVIIFRSLCHKVKVNRPT